MELQLYEQGTMRTTSQLAASDRYKDGRLFQSSVTAPTASIKKAPELFAAKDLILAGGELPKARTRYMLPREVDSMLAEVDCVVAPFKDALRRAGGRHDTVPEKVMAVIKKSSIQTTLTRFDDPDAMADFSARLYETIRRGDPVIMAMPEGGGKAHMPFKTGNFGGGPDFAEFLSLKIRASTVSVLREVYAGGAHMVAVPDVPLHENDLGMCPVTAKRHAALLHQDLPRLGITDEVVIGDTMRFLPEQWFDVIKQGTQEVRANIEHDESVRQSMMEQAQSLVFARNSLSLWESEEQALLLFAAIAGSPEGIPEKLVNMARDFMRDTIDATAMYMAINHHGIRGLNLIARVVDGMGFCGERHLRCSVHAKPGNPRPALSVSHSMAPPALLPKHSVGLRVLGRDKPRWGLTFDIVARMRNWCAVHEASTGRFMFYEGEA